jgi:hypothetical protein
MLPNLNPIYPNTTQPCTGGPLQIPWPNSYPTPHVPKAPLCYTIHNPHAMDTNSYIIVDDMSQSLASFSPLKVFQTCPSQIKDLLFALGVIDPSNAQLITFELDNFRAEAPIISFFLNPSVN